jgi:hypothetical protein
MFFFLKKYYDLEEKEIKESVTALDTKKYSALHMYKKKIWFKSIVLKK